MEFNLMYKLLIRDIITSRSASEGNLFFTGEHCSIDHGWIQGAIISSLKVIEELVTKYKQPKKQAHLQFAQANTQTKNCKRACFATADKIVLKKFPYA